MTRIESDGTDDSSSDDKDDDEETEMIQARTIRMLKRPNPSPTVMTVAADVLAILARYTLRLACSMVGLRVLNSLVVWSPRAGPSVFLTQLATEPTTAEKHLSRVDAAEVSAPTKPVVAPVLSHASLTMMPVSPPFEIG